MTRLTLEQLDKWLNFFRVKTRHYALMSYATTRFDRNQLFLWKFFCGSIVLTFSVFVPAMWMPWSGYTFDGYEYSPPLLYFTVLTSMLSAVSLFVAAYNVFRALDSSRLIVRRRIRACSWEMLDWVLYEISTTAAIMAFLVFWLAEIPASSSHIDVLRIQGMLVQFAVTCLDFFFTTPYFRSSHVLLALVWPSLWLSIQLVWLLCGHQPSSELVDFHTWHAPFSILGMQLVTAGVFYLLQRLAFYLRVRPLEEPTKPTVDPNNEEGKMSMLDTTPEHRVRGLSQSATSKYELMAKSQRGEPSLIRGSTASSDMESGVYRIGSDTSNSEDDHLVVAMGSWVGTPPHEHEHGRPSAVLHRLL